jgi:hypothetical protein
MRKPSPAMIVALLGVFLGLGGVGIAATGGNFILGQANTAGAKTSLTAGINDRALLVSNTNTGSNAAGLSLNVAPHHAPLVVNADAGKATNLNADKLDALDSSDFLPKTGTATNSNRLGNELPSHYLPASEVRRFGPVVIPRTPNDQLAPASLIVTVGQFSFYAICYASQQGFGSQGSLFVGSSADHAAYAALTEAGLTDPTGDSSPWSNADMAAYPQGLYYVANENIGAGVPSFTPVTGELLAANGQEVSFNLYMGQNVRGDTGCTFGGSFVVK